MDVGVDRGVGAVGGAGEGEDGQGVFALAGVEDDDVRVDGAAAVAGGERSGVFGAAREAQSGRLVFVAVEVRVAELRVDVGADVAA